MTFIIYDNRNVYMLLLSPGQMFLSDMVAIPAYVTIDVVVATGIQSGGGEAFVTMMDKMKKEVKSIEKNYNMNQGKEDTGKKYLVECSGSAVECRTWNRVSPGLNPLCYRFDVWAFLFSPRCPS